MIMRVDVADGKYTVILDSGELRALPWHQERQDCCGEKLILALTSELEVARNRIKELEAKVRDQALEIITLIGQEQEK